MFSLLDRVPKYLLEKNHLVTTVLFAALFSVIFILLSMPFSSNAWFKLEASRVFGFTVAFFSLSLIVVACSKGWMYTMRLKGMNYLGYIFWCLAEIVVIALLYSFFTIQGAKMGMLNIKKIEFFQIFGNAVVYGIVSLGVPYTVSALYFAIQDKDNTIRMLNMENVVTDRISDPGIDRRITLFDNNGQMKFSVNQDNLLFMMADDNYIQVWYSDTSGSLKQYMLRCRLKTVEDSFSDSDLVRCHRKYIVNINKVKILKSEDKCYLLDFGIDSVDPIPVSKTYEQAVLARFNSR